MFKNALVSVSDKTGLIDFLKPFYEQGMRIVSTGGTATFLVNNGFDVVQVSEQTEFPEVMDGRVKTLHPKIHMALLARNSHPEDLKILNDYSLQGFDLVVGNLYPFENALKENRDNLLEYIDIGGPSFLRAAAKNYHSVSVVVDPNDYKEIVTKKQTKVWNLDDRRRLAAKVFSHISYYDSLISSYLNESLDSDDVSFSGKKIKTLRYGENPHQSAVWYADKSARFGLQNLNQLGGKDLSYNNILDIDAALSCLQLFSKQICAVAVKHNNPCGVAVGNHLKEALEKSLSADPVSVFGGIVAMNKKVEDTEANLLNSIFLECVIAPDYSELALEILSRKKNLRIIQLDVSQLIQKQKIKSVFGGYLTQSIDAVNEWSKEWIVYGQEPTLEDKLDLSLAWKVCSQLKSNAISMARNGQTIGLGMGQVNRIDAVIQAIGRQKHFHPEISDPILASDAFFPFPDSIDKAAEAGVKWIIQPGGSIKDQEVLQRAKDLGINMVLTGKRHFLH